MKPTPEEVRLQLGRILASDGFANADRMSGFLRYVVDQELAGESARVKEYVIGVEVFARDQSYDPRLDSIVRVEARRLRAKVDEYYAGTGASDPVLIKLRRGSYVPAFEHRADAAPQAVAEPVTLPPPLIANPVVPSARRIGTAARIGLALSLAALVLVMLAARRGPWATTAPDVDVAVLPFAEYLERPDRRRAGRPPHRRRHQRARPPRFRRRRLAYERAAVRPAAAASGGGADRRGPARGPPGRGVGQPHRQSGCRVDSPGERQPRSQDVGRRFHRHPPRSARARAPDRPGRRARGRPLHADQSLGAGSLRVP